MNFINSFLNALGFLSIVPGRKSMLEPDDFGRFPGVFPLVGLVLGAILLAFYYATRAFLAPGLLAIALTALLVVLTRGFHLDGLADAADALFSHKSREEKLRIMKDSRQGTFGVLAIVLDILLKQQMLSQICAAPNGIAPALILLFPVWGRLAATVTAVFSGYVREEGGLGAYIVDHSNRSDFAKAAACGLVLSLAFCLKGVLIYLLVLVFARALTWAWKKALGGLTGDLLGATVELGELFALFCALLISA